MKMTPHSLLSSKVFLKTSDIDDDDDDEKEEEEEEDGEGFETFVMRSTLRSER